MAQGQIYTFELHPSPIGLNPNLHLQFIPVALLIVFLIFSDFWLDRYSILSNVHVVYGCPHCHFQIQLEGSTQT